MDEALLRGSIWLSLIAWAAAEWKRLSGRSARPEAGRLLWTAGAILASWHVAAAFHLHHGWSQTSALQETARQTEALLGIRFGGGLFVNYAFLAVWLLDALWWWLGSASFAERPRALDAAVRAFLLFIFVNGSIVFGHGAVRLLGLLALLALGAAWYRGRSMPRVRA